MLELKLYRIGARVKKTSKTPWGSFSKAVDTAMQGY